MQFNKHFVWRQADESQTAVCLFLLHFPPPDSHFELFVCQQAEAQNLMM